MDTFAAFALATEPPHNDVIDGAPYKNNKVFTKAMWGQIAFMTLYNTIVILTLLFSSSMLGLDYNYRSDPNAGAGTDMNCGENQNEDCSLNKLKHMTYIFNAFIFLQLFNQINCRKIGEGSTNVFDSITGNKYFIAVILGEFFIQWSTTYYSVPRNFTK